MTYHSCGSGLDGITQTLDSLEFVLVSLNACRPADDEHCISAAELAGLNLALSAAREYAEFSYNQLLKIHQVESQKTTHEIPEQQTIEAGGLLATLSQVVECLQCLNTLLERTELVEHERLFSPVDIHGFLALLSFIKSTTETCFAQWPKD